ncbi:MAG TPA: hypothetical protein VL970_11525 [Candidatus Acidoferrales bacterium]|nr:hypothetical protein [Candidatus Acidoferrales bacterium]
MSTNNERTMAHFCIARVILISLPPRFNPKKRGGAGSLFSPLILFRVSAQYARTGSVRRWSGVPKQRVKRANAASPCAALDLRKKLPLLMFIREKQSASYFPPPQPGGGSESPGAIVGNRAVCSTGRSQSPHCARHQLVGCFLGLASVDLVRKLEV